MERPKIFSGLLPSCDSSWSSITETRAYQLLYGSQDAINHFKGYKNELPSGLVLQNKLFLEAVAEHEPGVKIDYFTVRVNLAKVRPDYSLAPPFIFDVLENLLKQQASAAAIAAEYVSFDVFVNIMKSYYQPNHDIPLLRQMSLVTKENPHALTEYLNEALAFQNRNVLGRIERRLKELQDRAELAYAKFVAIKTPHMFLFVIDLQRMMDAHNHFQRARNEIRRAIRAKDAHDEELTIGENRMRNRVNMKDQMGQAGRHPLRQPTIDSIAYVNELHTVKLIQGGTTAASALLDANKNGWEIHPDTMEAMNMPRSAATHEEASGDQDQSNAVNTNATGSFSSQASGAP